jgi:hypothetical protein
MRAYYVLAAVVALLAVADFSAATTVDQTQLSDVVSPASANAIEAAQMNNQRFLRKRKVDVQDEERGGDSIKSFGFIMKSLEGKGVQRAFHELQVLKLPLAQRKAMMGGVG